MHVIYIFIYSVLKYFECFYLRHITEDVILNPSPTKGTTIIIMIIIFSPVILEYLNAFDQNILDTIYIRYSEGK